MRTLIIPDVHTHHLKAQKIIDNETFDKIIFGGDFFDQFDDSPIENMNTAVWLKEIMAKHKIEILLSNHDAAYRWYKNKFLYCSGFTLSKALAINNVITLDDWLKFQPWIVEQGFLLSHAGVSKRLYDYICKSREIESKEKFANVITFLEDETPKALEMADDYDVHPFFAASYYRGGMSTIPGLIWCDYREFVPIKKVNQIFFHTPLNQPACKTMGANGNIGNWLADSLFQNNDANLVSYNYDLDTHLKFYGILENKQLSIYQAFEQEVFNKKLVFTKQH